MIKSSYYCCLNYSWDYFTLLSPTDDWQITRTKSVGDRKFWKVIGHELSCYTLSWPRQTRSRRGRSGRGRGRGRLLTSRSRSKILFGRIKDDRFSCFPNYGECAVSSKGVSTPDFPKKFIPVIAGNTWSNFLPLFWAIFHTQACLSSPRVVTKKSLLRTLACWWFKDDSVTEFALKFDIFELLNSTATKSSQSFPKVAPKRSNSILTYQVKSHQICGPLM